MVREAQREFHCEEGAVRSECLARDDATVFKFDRPLALTVDLGDVYLSVSENAEYLKAFIFWMERVVGCHAVAVGQASIEVKVVLPPFKPSKEAHVSPHSFARSRCLRALPRWRSNAPSTGMDARQKTRRDTEVPGCRQMAEARSAEVCSTCGFSKPARSPMMSRSLWRT